MLGLTQEYIAPFALALKATTAQIGLLSSIPNLTMALSQLSAPRLVEKTGSRKSLILPMVLIHSLMWLPILLIPYMFPGDRVWWLIGLMTLSTVFGSLPNPAWGSMMADMVPETERGKYFSRRGRICGLVTLVFSFIAGAVLQWFTGNIFLGFSIIFGGSILFRLISWYFLWRMDEPPQRIKRGQRFGMAAIAKNLCSSNLGRFTIYFSALYFMVCLAGPFFAVYMLRDLKFDYLTYVAINATATLSSLIFLTYWGKRTDRAGNMKILKITSVLIPVVPVLWLVSKQVYFLIPVQILSGFAWSGFGLASTNFLYDASKSEVRTQNIALFNAISGVAMCLGSLTGGFIAPHLPRLFGNNLLTLFLLSGVLRAVVVASLLGHIREVRQVPKIGALELIAGKPRFVWPGIGSLLESVFSGRWFSPMNRRWNSLFPVWSLEPIASGLSPPVLDDS
jgi:MFS family permease